MLFAISTNVVFLCGPLTLWSFGCFEWNRVKRIKPNFSFISDSSMEVDKKRAKINPKTLKNVHGNYPVWMSQRKVRKVKKMNKIKEKMKAKAKKKT